MKGVMRGFLVRVFLALVALGAMGQPYPPNSTGAAPALNTGEHAVPAAEPDAWESVEAPASKPVA